MTIESANPEIPTPVTLDEQKREPDTLAKRTMRRFFAHRMAVTGTIILAFIAAYVLIGSFVFSEADANFNDTSVSLTAPSTEHFMGTDRIGRDVMARTIYGGQISLMIGVFAMTMSVTVGIAVGLFAGFYGGWVDGILMRVTEAFLSIPQLLILLVLANFLGGRIEDVNLFGRQLSGSVAVIIFIIGLTSWMYLSRIVRSTVLSLKETEFVLATRALGASNRRIILSHILPNTLAPVIVAGTLGVANAILAEAYISFLGMGVRAPTATWGTMLADSRQHIEEAPWLWLFPGLLILFTVMSINFVGDGLRDAVDPRSDK
jgi:peptide/nickel transport system permease protein